MSLFVWKHVEDVSQLFVCVTLPPQIVGNLVYYRYMNPAIVAPDGFDVVDRSAGSTLQPEQRHILGSIARMLQHAAANKHFHGDGYHVKALNQYISQTHDKFRSDAPHEVLVPNRSIFIKTNAASFENRHTVDMETLSVTGVRTECATSTLLHCSSWARCCCFRPRCGWIQI